jgi:trimeric autotransporter adhesin
MRKLLLLIPAFACFQLSAQLTPNGNSGQSTTAYTNGAPNDPIYIWCDDVLSTTQGSLTATTTNGTGPYTFNWFYHNQSTASWAPLTTQTGTSSTINSLASDGYRVEIRDASNVIVDCFVAWVWNLNTEVVPSASRFACNNANLQSTVNTTGSFSYYNTPPSESLINPTTSISVCFSATHTYVSDLAFYLIGPPSCGSPVVPLSPNPGAIGQGSICNSGNDVNGLCFTTSPAGNLNVCTASAPLTGTYSSYGPSSTPINWSSLIGCNAASGGWRVQIFDCIGADVGYLTNANLTFSNLTSVCGSPTTISYSSGSINSYIADNSCSQATASIFQVPPSPDLTTPITINATTTLLWTGGASIANPTNGSTTASGLPVGTTTFDLTATTTYGSTTCSTSEQTSVTYALPVVSAGPDQQICEGLSVTLSGSGASTYSWDNGVSNGVPFTPSSTQTYTVTGTDASGCQGTDQVTVTLNPLSTVSAGQHQEICPGESVTLTGSGASTYTWDNGVSNGVPFAPSSTQTYTVTGTDANGCEGTDEVIVTVNPLPPVNAGPDQAVCMNSSVTLSGSGASTYSWSAGVSNGVPFTPQATQTYTVTGTDANGCVNTDQVTVTVNPLPPVGAGSDITLCAGDSVLLSGTGASSYTWSGGIADNGPFVAVSTAIYVVTGTDANGCVSQDSVTVTVLPVPDAVIIVNSPLFGYPGHVVDIVNGSSYATGFDWDFGNGSVQTSSGSNDSYHPVYNSVGTYVITLVADNGYCSSSDSKTVVITLPPLIVYEIPNVFTPNGDGANELFNIRTDNAARLDIVIANRWGARVAEFDGLVKSWDGKTTGGDDATEGVYFYTYEITGIDGNTLTGQGYVELFR